MTEPTMQPVAAHTVDQAGFLNSALTSVPRWALATIGTALGLAIAIVFILVIGGMQGPVTRIANAYASQIEGSAARVERAADRLEVMASRIERVEIDTRRAALMAEDANRRLDRLEREVGDIEVSIVNHERRITKIGDPLKGRTTPKPTPIKYIPSGALQ